MADALAGYVWARDQVGESGAAVYRLSGRPGAPDLFLKTGTGPTASEIAGEMVRLEWLSGHLPVPPIRHFVFTPEKAWLLTEALPGRTAWQLLDDGLDPHAILDLLAAFLRRLHAIPAQRCPFTADHALRLAEARLRIDAGLVDPEDFDPERQGWTPEQVWEEIQRLLPISPDAVVTHGDFSLDNLLIADGRISGCIDAGRLGVADRYQDLAILWNNLGEFGEGLQKHLFTAYGIGLADQHKLRFHLLLDELF